MVIYYPPTSVQLPHAMLCVAFRCLQLYFRVEKAAPQDLETALRLALRALLTKLWPISVFGNVATPFEARQQLTTTSDSSWVQ